MGYIINYPWKHPWAENLGDDEAALSALITLNHKILVTNTI